MLRNERGAGLTEVLLAMGLVAAAAPFVYFRIAETGREISDISIAKQVLAYKSEIMNYIRLNQDLWDPTAEVVLSEESIDEIIPENARIAPHTVFIEKYPLKQGSGFEAYIAFRLEDYDVVRSAKLAKNLGMDAGLVGDDKIAYGVFGDWGATAEEFESGDLIYRIKTDFSSVSADRYLHRAASEGLNEMKRDLSLGKHELYDVADLSAQSIKSTETNALFMNTDRLSADQAVFPNGAVLDAENAKFGSIRANGDLTGFRTITAKTVGTSGMTGWSMKTDVIADRANITESVHVGNNLLLKSSAAKTISGFAGASAHSAFVPFLATTELFFAPGFGITVSSELLSSSTYAPLKLGSWTFPSASYAPKFSVLYLTSISGGNAATSVSVPGGEFSKIMASRWKEL